MTATVTAASARYRELVPRGLKRARLVLATTQAIADEVIAEYSLNPDQVRVTPLGVNEDWFADGHTGSGGITRALPALRGCRRATQRHRHTAQLHSESSGDRSPIPRRWCWSGRPDGDRHSTPQA